MYDIFIAFLLSFTAIHCSYIKAFCFNAHAFCSLLDIKLHIMFSPVEITWKFIGVLSRQTSGAMPNIVAFTIVHAIPDRLDKSLHRKICQTIRTHVFGQFYTIELICDEFFSRWNIDTHVTRIFEWRRCDSNVYL